MADKFYSSLFFKVIFAVELALGIYLLVSTAFVGPNNSDTVLGCLLIAIAGLYFISLRKQSRYSRLLMGIVAIAQILLGIWIRFY